MEFVGARRLIIEPLALMAATGFTSVVSIGVIETEMQMWHLRLLGVSRRNFGMMQLLKQNGVQFVGLRKLLRQPFVCTEIIFWILACDLMPSDFPWRLFDFVGDETRRM